MNAAETVGLTPANGGEELDRASGFEALFRANSRAILGYGLRRCAREEDAADVLAEVMLVAWRRWVDVPKDETARLWLYGVARNVVANRSRTETRQLRVADRLRGQISAQSSEDPFERRDASEAVRAALTLLSDQDREVLLLSAWEDLGPTEIASVLDLTPVAVRSRLHRARTRLREQLDVEPGPALDLPSDSERADQKGRL